MATGPVLHCLLPCYFPGSHRREGCDRRL